MRENANATDRLRDGLNSPLSLSSRHLTVILCIIPFIVRFIDLSDPLYNADPFISNYSTIEHRSGQRTSSKDGRREIGRKQDGSSKSFRRLMLLSEKLTY